MDQVRRLTQNIEKAYDEKQIYSVPRPNCRLQYCLASRIIKLKLTETFKFHKLSSLIMNLLYSRSFILHTSDGNSSKPYKLKNGVAQRLVLAPTLCNIYTADFPTTFLTKCMYADIVALTYCAQNFKIIESNISSNMYTICNYLKQWRLKLSTSKTVVSSFYIRSHLATDTHCRHQNSNQTLSTLVAN